MNMKQILNHTALTKARLSILSASITALICSSVGASDIDIYTAPSTAAGATTMLFMLDTSGSMRFVDYATNTSGSSFSTYDPNSSTGCQSSWNGTNKTFSIGISGSKSKGTKSITLHECQRNNYITTMNRLNKMKKGLLQALLGDHSDANNKIEPLADEVYIGLATFGNNKGEIKLEAKRLDEKYYIGTKNQTHRMHLADIIAGLTQSGGTPTPFAYAEAGAYLMGTKTGGGTYSNSSSNYTKPASISSQTTPALKECSAQGVYFLTDGRPEPIAGSSTASTLMQTALGTNTSGWSCSATDSSKLGMRGSYHNANNAWNCIGRFTERLLNPTLNPAGIKIMTAVVGFGKDFDGSNPTNDVLDAMDWGTLGEGGWYSGQNPEDIVESIESYLGKIKTNIPGSSTGNATLPIDALNSNTIQAYGYFPQFVPKVATTELQRTWYGNLKKYHAVDGSLYANRSGTYPGTITGSNPVMQNDEIKNVTDLWNNADYITSSNETAFKGGALSNLLQGYNADRTPKERLLLTDFNYKDGVTSQNLNLSWYDDSDKKTKFNAITTAYNLNGSAPYRAALMGLLGYEN